MPGSTQSDDVARFERSRQVTLEEPELEAALQLLVERAQFITGATGTALALPQGTEMVCRASAGSCAPVVGARLQVRSGLTGESIARRQLLRCDNAETDPRVNLDACRALGIASIIVLPMLRPNGEVRGLFELFSDHPYAFEERDLIALERMADLTLTALDLAEQRHGSVPPYTPSKELAAPAKLPVPIAPIAIETPQPVATSTAPPEPATPEPAPPEVEPGQVEPGQVELGQVQPAQTQDVEPAAVSIPTVAEAVTTEPAVVDRPDAVRESAGLSQPAVFEPAVLPQTEAPPDSDGLSGQEPVHVAEDEGQSPSTALPSGMLRVQKCASCGFPVSEGRTLCLDCEKKEKLERRNQERQRALEDAEKRSDGNSALSFEPSGAPVPDEALPPFLVNAQPVTESWLANHVNLLAILVLIVGILVAVVVFR